MSGLFITFEGVEGCGKSTQIQALRTYLDSLGHALVVTREPGGTPIAEIIRQVLLDPANGAMAPVSELLLYEAARAQLVHEVIQPALVRGEIVLCDRFADSTTAYQGAGRGLLAEDIEGLHRIATAGVWPDLTFLFDLDPAKGLARAHERGRADRMEQQELAFHERVRQGFLDIAGRETERVDVVDGGQSIKAIAKTVRRRVDQLLEARLPASAEGL